MAFFTGTSEKEKRGEIPIDGQCRVEVVADSHSKSPIKTPGSKRHSKFQLFACQKTYEFQASDHRTRLQWVNAIKIAIENAEQPIRWVLFERLRPSNKYCKSAATYRDYSYL